MNIIFVQFKKIGTQENKGNAVTTIFHDGILKPVTRFTIRDKYILNE